MRIPLAGAVAVTMILGAVGTSGCTCNAKAPPRAEPAAPAVSTEPRASPAKPTVESALCRARYRGASLDAPGAVRSTWQFNPGTTVTDFDGTPSYPCRAFQFARVPAMDAASWTAAKDGALVGFDERSPLCADPPKVDYTRGQFRYFRSLVWIPPGFALKSLKVTAEHIDDAVKLWIYNSRHPGGMGPDTACHGNGDFAYDLAPHAAAGEVNVVVVAHVDVMCPYSKLGPVSITANDAPIELHRCGAAP